jgi:hypothetical protein
MKYLFLIVLGVFLVGCDKEGPCQFPVSIPDCSVAEIEVCAQTARDMLDKEVCTKYEMYRPNKTMYCFSEKKKRSWDEADRFTGVNCGDTPYERVDWCK